MQKDIVTAHWGITKTLMKQGYDIVGVSRGCPKSITPSFVLNEVAPTWAMMKMDAPAYNNAYSKMLGRLNPQHIYDLLPEKTALMCYEKHPKWCHRRMLAEWLEDGNGIIIPEFGFSREETCSYMAMCGLDSLSMTDMAPSRPRRNLDKVADFYQPKLF